MAGHCVTLAELIDLRHQAQALALFTNGDVKTDRIGAYTSSFRGRGMDFEEVRYYQPGDDIRSMDWRVTARTGEPHTKVFREERERPVYCAVDFSDSMYFGTKVMFKTVLAAKLAALISWAAAQHHDRVGGVIFSPEYDIQLRPKTRKAGVLPLLKALADCTHKPPQQIRQQDAMAHSLLQLRRVTKPGSVVTLISDFEQFSDEAKRHLSRLAHSAQVYVLLVCDPLEIAPPPANIYRVSDGADYLTLNTQQKNLCTQYRELFATKYETVKTFCDQHGIGLLQVATDDDYLKVLQVGMRR